MDQGLSSIVGAHELPATSRVIGRTRDVIVIDIPSLQTKPKPTFTRTAITLDPSGDPRIFSVIIARQSTWQGRVNHDGRGSRGSRSMLQLIVAGKLLLVALLIS